MGGERKRGKGIEKNMGGGKRKSDGESIESFSKVRKLELL